MYFNLLVKIIKRNKGLKLKPRQLLYSTKFTKDFDCKYPIVLAPMGHAAGSNLASEVVNAGGIGFVGTGFGSQPEENWYSSKSALIGTISKRFREAENLVDKPGNIGIGIVTAHCKADPSYFDQILSLCPKNIWLSGDGFEPYCEILKEKDFIYSDENPSIKVFVQVKNNEEAIKAWRLGADVIVVQNELARIPISQSILRPNYLPRIPIRIETSDMHPNIRSHTQFNGMSELISEINNYLTSYDEMKDLSIPIILAAGGISTHEHFMKYMNQGVDGVVVGLRLAATKESALDNKIKLDIMKSLIHSGIDVGPNQNELPSAKQVIDSIILNM